MLNIIGKRYRIVLILLLCLESLIMLSIKDLIGNARN